MFFRVRVQGPGSGFRSSPRYLVLPHQRNIISEYKLYGKPIIKEKQTFLLIPESDVAKTC